MIGAILDHLLGRRYRKGWPRNVRPVFPELEHIKREDPALWDEVKDMTLADALAAIRRGRQLERGEK